MPIFQSPVFPFIHYLILATKVHKETQRKFAAKKIKILLPPTLHSDKIGEWRYTTMF